jgi:predicted nucleic acid-binding protein
MGQVVNYLPDTTILIDHSLGLGSAVRLFRQLSEDGHDLLTCDVVTAEALSGGTDDQRSAIRRLLDALEYVSTTPDDARWAAESRRHRGATRHRTLGDALIAAVAHRNNATIVTRNPRDFEAQGVRVMVYG